MDGHARYYVKRNRDNIIQFHLYVESKTQQTNKKTEVDSSTQGRNGCERGRGTEQVSEGIKDTNFQV